MTVHLEILTLDEHDHGQQDDREPETVGQHGGRIHTLLIERQGAEWVSAVAHCRQDGTQEADGFTLFHCILI